MCEGKHYFITELSANISTSLHMEGLFSSLQIFCLEKWKNVRQQSSDKGRKGIWALMLRKLLAFCRKCDYQDSGFVCQESVEYLFFSFAFSGLICIVILLFFWCPKWYVLCTSAWESFSSRGVNHFIRGILWDQWEDLLCYQSSHVSFKSCKYINFTWHW